MFRDCAVVGPSHSDVHGSRDSSPSWSVSSSSSLVHALQLLRQDNVMAPDTIVVAPGFSQRDCNVIVRVALTCTQTKSMCFDLVSAEFFSRRNPRNTSAKISLVSVSRKQCGVASTACTARDDEGNVCKDQERLAVNPFRDGVE